MEKKRKLFITTPIYYASGKPHIGHAYTTILADVIARYKKAIGYDVFLLTGMDEHGQKIADTAKKKNLKIVDMLEQVKQDFSKLWLALGIDNSGFIRTTDIKHEQAVQKVFSELLKNNYIYEGTWKGLYCVDCEENYTRDQAIEKNGELYCKVGHKLTTKNEPTYFLKVSQFSDWIAKQLPLEGFITPKSRVNELLGSFINKGLEDLSITRTSFDWGIQVLENKQHIIYVWIDALLSYLSGLGYLSNDDSNFKKYWIGQETQVIHLMSKEITRFHCIYWPILLKMLGLRLPDRILSHGWIITKEGKMSKSLGNVVDPFDYIKEYDSDSFRYVVVRLSSFERDTVFSREIFNEIYNNELANNYGNMISRVSSMIIKYFDHKVPQKDLSCLDELDKAVMESHTKFIDSYKGSIESLDINGLLDEIQDQYNMYNKYIENKKPWALAKDISKKGALANCLNILFNATYDLCTLLKPIIVTKTKLVEKMWNIEFVVSQLKFDHAQQIIAESYPIFIRKTIKK